MLTQVAPTVLILENQMMIATKVSRQFSKLGYNVLGVITHNEDALDTIGISRPDIVMMNIDIRNKVESLKVARSILETFLIPVVFINSNVYKNGIVQNTKVPPYGLNNSNTSKNHLSLVENKPSPTSFKSLCFQHKGKAIKIEMDDLLYVEAKRNACQLSTRLRTYQLGAPLKSIEDQLPDSQFVRVHRSYLVNLRRINALTSQGDYLTIQDHKIPISRRLKTKVLQYIERL